VEIKTKFKVRALPVAVLFCLILLSPIQYHILHTEIIPLGKVSSVFRGAGDVPLEIDGNAQLNATATSGNGTLGWPFVIEGKVINASGSGKPAIFIRNTNAHFILRDCVVTTAGIDTGVVLHNLSNAWVENITAFANYYGISLSYVNQSTITRSNISGNLYYGVLLIESSWNNITWNKIFNNSYFGIYLQSSTKNEIRINTAKFNIQGGIVLDWFSNGNYLIDNQLEFNAVGLAIGRSVDNTAVANSIVGHTKGVFLYEADGNIITLNQLQGNDQGMYLMRSDNNLITKNSFIGNQVDINETQCIGNTISGNTYGECLECIWLPLTIGLASLGIFSLIFFYWRRRVHLRGAQL
jgi:parallel beta-helix repeat protein